MVGRHDARQRRYSQMFIARPGLEGTLKIISFQPLEWQEHLPLDEVAPSIIQPGFGYFMLADASFWGKGGA